MVFYCIYRLGCEYTVVMYLPVPLRIVLLYNVMFSKSEVENMLKIIL